METNLGLLSLSGATLIAQYFAWLLALLQFILALYVMVVNAWQQPVIRRVSYYLATALLILALHTFAIGSLAGATYTSQTYLPTVLLAFSAPALSVALLLGSISLLRFDLLYPNKLRSTADDKSTRREKATFYGSIVLRWGAILLLLLPILFTLIDLIIARSPATDVVQTTRLWYTGVDPNMAYSGGYLPRATYANGSLAGLIIAVHFVAINLVTLGYLVYETVLIIAGSRRGKNRVQDPARNRLVWLLLLTFLPGLAISSLPTGAGTGSATSMIYILASNTLLTIAYALAIFQRLTTNITEPSTGSEAPAELATPESAFSSKTADAAEPGAPEKHTRKAFGASLQARLVSATIVVVLPLLAAMGILLTRQAQQQLEVNAAQTLTQLNQSLGEHVLFWVDTSLAAMQNVAASPAIRSMDPATQQATLESTAATYPDFYLVSTLDLQGDNLARSDRQPGRNYSSQTWFQKVSETGAIVYQPMVGRDIWKPDLLMAIPIYSSGSSETGGEIVGYLMAISTLKQVSARFQETRLGEQGFALLVDDQSRLLAHPDWAQEFIQTQFGLQDMTSHPPVAALHPAGDTTTPLSGAAQQGAAGTYRFSDAEGRTWQAAMRRLDNGWGLIVQQRQDELLAPIAAFRRIAIIVLLAGVAMLIPLMLLTVRNSLLPVQKLTETASAIASGRLDQLAPLEIASQPGEIGLLARTFNAMTLQLRQMIGGLEQRVAERTQAVQRRAIQLQVTAEVAREAASIREPEELLRNIVNLISERFGFYHAGIFLVTTDTSAAEGYAILQAASSEGGKRMLARHHRLKAGPAGSGIGIVGYVAYTGQPRIALDTGSDAVFFNNPDLPLTRSEMALPLMIASQATGSGAEKSRSGDLNRKVIGVLDVQSTEPAAFGQEDIEILQILADQVAVALENARLLTESRQALQQLQQIYGERIRQSWQERLSMTGLKGVRGEITYTFDSSRLRSVIALEGSSAALETSATPGSLKQDKQAIVSNIELRGQKLGQLMLKRDRPWSQQERELIRETMEQVALAVENARLLEDIQQRAFQEEQVSQMVAQTQKSLDLETVMRSLILEIAQATRVERIQLQLLGATPSTAQNTPMAETPPPGGGDDAQ